MHLSIEGKNDFQVLNLMVKNKKVLHKYDDRESMIMLYLHQLKV